MRALVASDSFKAALGAREVCRSIADGLRAGWPELQVTELPLADGGEGTLAALIEAGAAVRLGDREATIRLTSRAARALQLSPPVHVIEVADSVGFGSCGDIASASSDALAGQIMNAAQGAKTLLIGLGGTGIADGGRGLIRGLSGGERSLTKATDAVANVDLIGLCDVQAPLLGPAGAYQFMAQKGASPTVADALHTRLDSLAGELGRAFADVPGAGAGGGLGFAIAALGGKLVSGAEWICDLVGLDTLLADHDMVFGGEGRYDHQTDQGKVLAVLRRRATAAGLDLIVLCGADGRSDSDVMTTPRAVFSIQREPTPLVDAVARTSSDLTRTATSVARLMRARSPRR